MYNPQAPPPVLPCRKQQSFMANHGFSLVELLTVIAIIGILAAMVIPAYNNYIDKTRNGRAASEIRTISTEISGYALDKGAYPPSLAVPEINRINFLDPWKRQYVYRLVTDPTSDPIALRDPLNIRQLNSVYDLYCKGQDGNSQADGGAAINVDDIVLFNDGAYIGLREPAL
jgi:type II secretion system protein G